MGKQSIRRNTLSRLERPLSDEPHSLVDSWPFLIPGCLIAVGILIARVAGVL